MSAASVYAPRHQYEVALWRLLDATVFETEEIASVLPASLALPSYDVVRNLWSLLRDARDVRGGIRRIGAKQDRLIDRFRTASFENWRQKDCGQMAVLLDELIRDEKDMLVLASKSPKPIRMLWGVKMLGHLRSQVGQLEIYCHRLDALSVPGETLPGDSEMNEFLVSLRASEEYDFSLD